MLFLTGGRIELDNDPVERTIHPVAINRKNALFASRDTGSENLAMIELIETSKLDRIDPQAWLTDPLTAIVNGHKKSQIDDLLPWNSPTQSVSGIALTLNRPGAKLDCSVLAIRVGWEAFETATSSGHIDDLRYAIAHDHKQTVAHLRQAHGHADGGGCIGGGEQAGAGGAHGGCHHGG